MCSEMGFTPRPDDVYVASYPRSGTTWMQMILSQLRSHDEEPAFDHISDVVPFWENCLRRGDDLDSLTSPRLFKTHLPARHVLKNAGRFIYVVRDGRDVLVSYFYFYRTYLKLEKEFSEFVEDFIAGNVRYGSWFKHVAEWQAHANEANVLFVRYEDLFYSLTSCLEKLTAFLHWPNSEAHYAVIAERCSFSKMKEQERKFAPLEARDVISSQENDTFLRKGHAGTWRDHLTAEHRDAFENASRIHFWQPDL